MRSFILWIIYCIVASNIGYANLSNNQKIELSKLIKNYYENVFNPRSSVSIVNNKESLFNKNLGYLDIKQKEPVTQDSQFKLTNITQTLTALIIFDLEKENKLQLTDSIQNHLPELTANHFKDITVKDLLQHYSGLSRDYWGCSFNVIECDTKSFLRFINKEAPIYGKNENIYNYSNNGYVLLGILIERVTKKSYEEVASTYLKTVLNMQNSHFNSDKLKAFKGYREKNDIKTSRGIFLSSVGLISTTKEIGQFIQHFLNKENHIKPSIDPKNSKVGIYENDIRLPWIFEKEWFIYYGGSLNSQSIVMFSLKHNIGISILHNSYAENYINNLTTEIINYLNLKTTTPGPFIKNITLDNYSGTYSSFFGTYFLYKDNDHYLSSYNSHKIKLTPNQANKFDLTFMLFSILPIRTQEIKNATIYTSRKQNRDRLILEYKGKDKFVFGEKIPILLYKNTEDIIGEYVSNNKNNPIKRINIIVENKTLICEIESDFFEQFIDTDRLKIPLKQINKRKFVSYGLGIEWDGTFSFKDNTLSFSGLTFYQKISINYLSKS